MAGEDKSKQPSWRWLLRLDQIAAAVFFLAAVVQLFLLRRGNIAVLGLFLVPPAIALGCKYFPVRRSTRLMASLFLALVAFGTALGPIDRLLPDMRGFDKDLPAKDDRILTWYVVVYLGHLFFVMPVVVFGRGLLDHHKGRPAEFSRFTCYLGFLASLIVGPTMLFVAAQLFHLWPVIR